MSNSKNEEIRQFLLQNTHLLTQGYRDTAIKFGVSAERIRHICRRLRDKGVSARPQVHNKPSESTFEIKGDDAEYTFISKDRIITKDQLLATCDIDLSEWDIERLICNKWEVGAKNAKGKIEVTPLFQVKVTLKPKLQKVDLKEIIIEIVEQHVKGVPIIVSQEKSCDKAIKATLSDMHVGLEPNPENKSLFGYQYNEAIFNENLNKVFHSIMKEFYTHGRFDLLVLDDLGDGLDGWNGFTTRGGHKLDQNMNNAESFKAFVEGKLRLIENLISAGVANKIKVRNVTNDNHAGSFAQIANLTIQMILERQYDKRFVDFYILEKFMEHFRYGDHTFILTHGKDDKNMFKGLPLILNDKTTAFLNAYIDHYNINTKYIHVEKGDLHQVAYQRNKKFDYRNYMTFAPPSAYAQHNFADGYSGYSVQVVPKYENEISHTDYFFDMKKNLK